MPGSIDSVASLEQLQQISEMIPAHWLPAATGSAAQCTASWRDQLASGADGIVIHGTTPEEFARILTAYAELRE